MNPQLENGYTKIANEILEALCKFRIPGEQMQCLLVIFRKTYGYGKKEDAISNSQFVKETGLKKGNVSRAISELSKKQLVIKNDNGKIPTYRFNKDYSKWQVLSKLQPVINITTAVIKSDNKVLSKVMDTKEKKETITKEKTLVTSDKPKQPKESKNKSLLSLGEEDFFKTLEENPLYSGINIRTLNEKMKVWCAGRGVHPTRRRLINWLNREDKKVSGGNGGGHTAPAAKIMRCADCKWLKGACDKKGKTEKSTMRDCDLFTRKNENTAEQAR